jgi:hypothetical protein
VFCEYKQEAKRKERLKKVYLPPDATDEMARQEALAAQKVKEARTDGHEYWDFRGTITAASIRGEIPW